MMGDTVFVLPSGIAQPQVSQLRPPKWNEIKCQDTRLHKVVELDYSKTLSKQETAHVAESQKEILFIYSESIFSGRGGGGG